MTVSPRLWPVTFVSLVFVIGVSAGVLVDRTWLLRSGPPALRGLGAPGGRGGPGGPGPGPLVGPPPERIVADLDAQLHLSDTQRQQILDILETHRPRVRELQDDARQKFTIEQQALQDEIAKTLTPDQAAHFREMSTRGRQAGPMGPGRRGGR